MAYATAPLSGTHGGGTSRGLLLSRNLTHRVVEEGAVADYDVAHTRACLHGAHARTAARNVAIEAAAPDCDTQGHW